MRRFFVPACRQAHQAVVLGLVARQRHQPGFGLRCDGWFLVAGDRRGPPAGHRPVLARHSAAPSDDGPSLWPTAQNDGFSRYASSICARDTRLANSVRDRESVAARRHPAMIQLLVSPTANEESANKPSFPPTGLIHVRRFHGIDRLGFPRWRRPTSAQAVPAQLNRVV